MMLFRRVRIKTEIRFDDHGPGYLIFVGALGPHANEYDLVSLFQARFPSCKSAKIMTDPISGMSRGYGFVRFADESDQQRVLTEMQEVYQDPATAALLKQADSADNLFGSEF
jgi:RNA recognition motif-containing protein